MNLIFYRVCCDSGIDCMNKNTNYGSSNNVVSDENMSITFDFGDAKRIAEKIINASLRDGTYNGTYPVFGAVILKMELTTNDVIDLGKIKFNGQVHEGNHKSLVSSTLFNHVQNKLENLKIKNPNLK